MDELFWLSAHDYFLGSTVSPGHWGRVMSSCVVGESNSMGAARLPLALREYIFEAVRLTQSPLRPSRLASLFLCPSLPAAQQLLEREAPVRNHEYVYRVELVDDVPVFQASMDLAVIKPGDTVAAMTEKARRYWRGYETRHMELLTMSPIRICERISLDAPRGQMKRGNGAGIGASASPESLL
ncbi:MAG: DUF2441 domain-containing protein [Xanthomonadales bacterium]|nr:DUF2441 domain-containing protein [Xanthomonadales bacterium]